MRARPHNKTSHRVPAELRRFRPSEWTGDTRHALSQWRQARMDYWKSHPDAWPHALAVTAGGSNVRAKIDGQQPPYPQYDEGAPSLLA